MYHDPLAYFLTFTTYGTWLHGREAGSVDRQHRLFGTPMLPVDPGCEAKARQRMRQTVYTLDEPRREVVLKTILDVAGRRNWHVWAAHVRSNHVHVVITAPATKPEKVLADLKAWASRRLREFFYARPEEQESALRDRWTQHGSTKYLWNDSELAAAVEYVTAQQGEPMSVYRSSSTDP